MFAPFQYTLHTLIDNMTLCNKINRLNPLTIFHTISRRTLYVNPQDCFTKLLQTLPPHPFSNIF